MMAADGGGHLDKQARGMMNNGATVGFPFRWQVVNRVDGGACNSAGNVAFDCICMAMS